MSNNPITDLRRETSNRVSGRNAALATSRGRVPDAGAPGVALPGTSGGNLSSAAMIWDVDIWDAKPWGE